VAVKAFASPDTVKRFLRGKPTRSVSRARIEEAMRTLGFAEKPEVTTHNAA